MDMNEMKLSDIMKLCSMLSASCVGAGTPVSTPFPKHGEIENGMLGKYVIVRCRDAGVHAGILQAYHGRECLLTEARRLWYWKPESGKYLSGVANHGLDKSSKVGEPIIVHLTETCEIILCSDAAAKSIANAKPNT